jgi:hypothetical protein
MEWAIIGLVLVMVVAVVGVTTDIKKEKREEKQASDVDRKWVDTRKWVDERLAEALPKRPYHEYNIQFAVGCSSRQYKVC